LINTGKYTERVKYREIDEERVCERDGHSGSKRERERERVRQRERDRQTDRQTDRQR
jgi:hypothetical protein